MFITLIIALALLSAPQLHSMESENRLKMCAAITRLECACAHILKKNNHIVCVQSFCTTGQEKVSIFDALKTLTNEPEEKKIALQHSNSNFSINETIFDTLVDVITENMNKHIRSNNQNFIGCLNHPSIAEFANQSSLQENSSRINNHLKELLKPFIMGHGLNEDEYVKSISGPFTEVCVNSRTSRTSKEKQEAFTLLKNSQLIIGLLQASPEYWNVLFRNKEKIKSYKENYYNTLADKEGTLLYSLLCGCFGFLELFVLARMLNAAPHLFNFDKSAFFIIGLIGMEYCGGKIYKGWLKKQSILRTKNNSLDALDKILVQQNI